MRLLRTDDESSHFRQKSVHTNRDAEKKHSKNTQKLSRSICNPAMLVSSKKRETPRFCSRTKNRHLLNKYHNLLGVLECFSMVHDL